MKAGPRPNAQTYTIPEVAERLRICERHAYDLARRNDLPVPVISLGRAKRVSKIQFDRYLAGLVESGDTEVAS